MIFLRKRRHITSDDQVLIVSMVVYTIRLIRKMPFLDADLFHPKLSFITVIHWLTDVDLVPILVIDDNFMQNELTCDVN